ncbi:N-acetyltransferase 9 [Mactra antiquata]
MKTNQNTKIEAGNVYLVPYERGHVLKYHEWMKSEELQQLTASEPLTLDEEYKMQESWRNDNNKCTFIILSKEVYNKSCQNEIDSMVGDVNLFLNDDEDLTTAEIEIMIAEPAARGKGFGKEALLCMIRYGFESLKLETITAKIGYSNHPSISMFTKLGFQEESKSDVFEEITYKLKLTDHIKQFVIDSIPQYEIVKYR